MSTADWFKSAKVFLAKGDFGNALDKLEMIGMMDRELTSGKL